MKNAVSGVGLAPDAAMVTFPIDMFLPGSDITAVETRKREFYDGLTQWTSALAGARAGARPMLKDFLEKEVPSVTVLPIDTFPQGNALIGEEETARLVQQSGVDAVIVGNAA